MSGRAYTGYRIRNSDGLWMCWETGSRPVWLDDIRLSAWVQLPGAARWLADRYGYDFDDWELVPLT